MFIKRLFSYSSLFAIRMVSSAYLRLLIFLLTTLIPACGSSSPVFCMMCSAYKLNKQGDNIQPWCAPFPIWNQSVVLCPVLTVDSTGTQISQEKDQVVWYSISWKIFHMDHCIVIHAVKGFGIVRKAEVRCFSVTLLLFQWSNKCWKCWTVVLEMTLESPLDTRLNQSILKEINSEYSPEGLLKLKLPYFGHLMQRAYSLEKTLMLGKKLNLAFSKSSLNIWKFMVHVLLKPSLNIWKF